LGRRVRRSSCAAIGRQPVEQGFAEGLLVLALEVAKSRTHPAEALMKAGGHALLRVTLAAEDERDLVTPGGPHGGLFRTPSAEPGAERVCDRGRGLPLDGQPARKVNAS